MDNHSLAAQFFWARCQTFVKPRISRSLCVLFVSILCVYVCMTVRIWTHVLKNEELLIKLIPNPENASKHLKLLTNKMLANEKCIDLLKQKLLGCQAEIVTELEKVNKSQLSKETKLLLEDMMERLRGSKRLRHLIKDLNELERKLSASTVAKLGLVFSKLEMVVDNIISKKLMMDNFIQDANELTEATRQTKILAFQKLKLGLRPSLIPPIEELWIMSQNCNEKKRYVKKR